MKRFSAVILLTLCINASVFILPAQAGPSGKTSAAYTNYQKRPKTELSKLIYLMDYFRGTGYQVIFNNQYYDSATSLQHAKNYIAKHYRNENAAHWVSDNAYRSNGGQVIYLVSPDGKKEILRDALVRELKALG